MLAQSFLSHETLGLNQHQWASMIKVLGMLERGELRHIPRDDFRLTGGISRTLTGHFNMRCWQAETDCGTVCCIGGTIELVGNMKRGDMDAATLVNESLHDLFFPDPPAAWDANTEQAAAALRNFLTTGHPRWDEALAA